MNKMKLDAFFDSPSLLQKTIAISTSIIGISAVTGPADMATALLLQRAVQANRVADDIRDFSPSVVYSVTCAGDIHAAQLNVSTGVIVPAIYDAQTGKCWEYSAGNASSLTQSSTILGIQCAGLAAGPPWWYQYAIDTAKGLRASSSQKSGVLSTGRVGAIYVQNDTTNTACGTAHVVEAEYRDVSEMLSYSAGPGMTTYAMTEDWTLAGSNDPAVASILAKVATAAGSVGGLTARSAGSLKSEYTNMSAVSARAASGTDVHWGYGDRSIRMAAFLTTNGDVYEEGSVSVSVQPFSMGREQGLAVNVLKVLLDHCYGNMFVLRSFITGRGVDAFPLPA